MVVVDEVNNVVAAVNVVVGVVGELIEVREQMRKVDQSYPANRAAFLQEIFITDSQ